MALNLKIPSEAIFQEVKNSWKEKLRKGDDLTRWSIKQGTWLTTLLWKEYGWGKELKKRGINWQIFMHIYKKISYYFLGWAEGGFSWEEAIKSFIKEIEREIKQSKAGGEKNVRNHN